ncbi:MAG: hypothetical protein WED04_08210 [Promethearchaeati archaeon SRVP18_Atabeyarchaeia-1]
MKLQLRRAVFHPLKFLRSLGPFALAHHPGCEQFANHSLRLRNHRFCIGCFIGYPAFIASIVILWISSFLFGIGFGFIEAIIVGIAFESATIIVKALHAGESAHAKIAVKSSQGVGLGFIFYPFLMLQAPIIFKVYILFIIWSAFNLIIGAVRLYETGRTCEACEYKSRWSKCPGFRETVKRLRSSGFITD